MGFDCSVSCVFGIKLDKQEYENMWNHFEIGLYGSPNNDSTIPTGHACSPYTIKYYTFCDDVECYALVLREYTINVVRSHDAPLEFEPPSTEEIEAFKTAVKQDFPNENYEYTMFLVSEGG
jgi:hypothetical protein